MVSKTYRIAYTYVDLLYSRSRESECHISCACVCVCGALSLMLTPTHSWSYVDCLLSSYLWVPLCVCVCVCTRKRISSPILDRSGLTSSSLEKDSRREATIPRVVMSCACTRRWSPTAVTQKKQKYPERTLQPHANTMEKEKQKS
jgi:hypothetical protein